MGTAYRKKGEYNLAIKSYQKSLKSNKVDEAYKARCYGGLGLTYLHKGDEINANRNYVEAMNHLNGEHGPKERESMLNAIDKAKQKDPNLKGTGDIISLLNN
jgi:tetratricopeptide (TPR) repeat protein